MMNIQHWDKKQKTGLVIAIVCGAAFITEVFVNFLYPSLWNELVHNALSMLGCLGLIYGILLTVWDDFK